MVLNKKKANSKSRHLANSSRRKEKNEKKKFQKPRQIGIIGRLAKRKQKLSSIDQRRKGGKSTRRSENLIFF